MEKINENYDRKYFFDIMMHYRFTGGQSYVLLCIETTLSNPLVVLPKSSCDVHLLRSLCLSLQSSDLMLSLTHYSHSCISLKFVCFFRHIWSFQQKLHYAYSQSLALLSYLYRLKVSIYENIPLILTLLEITTVD